MVPPMFRSVLLFGLALLSLSAGAMTVAADPISYQKAGPAEFAAQVNAVETGLAPGGAYASLDARKQARVRELLGNMASELAGVDTIDALQPPQVARLFNAQEEANALLTGRAIAERMQCKRERKIGSNMVTMNCQVVADLDEREGGDVEGLSQNLRSVQRINDSGERRPN